MSKQWVTVTTTLPQSLGSYELSKGNEPHLEILTPRLLIRPLTQSDLLPFHRLRRQAEFMRHTTCGRPDRDLDETQSKLNDLISAPTSPHQLPFPTYFGVFLRTTDELIGDGGVHTLVSPACGWPELGCKFGREYCGFGYGTEFLQALTSWWWSLPRQRGNDGGRNDEFGPATGVERAGPVAVRIPVHPDTIIWECHGGQDEGDYGGDRGLRKDTAACRGDCKAIEQLYAWIAPDNHASQRMASKTGLEHFINWQHPIKKITVMGWRQSRNYCPAYLTKL
ncbi:acyl-CoA N-acyltransferase [Poronia punctata]|nr:acyl-CoA N-acyltransferase [Poronia punctata]